MTPDTVQSEPGGFPSGLPSPSASLATTTSIPTSALPQPRSHPLKPGSHKESSFVDYVDRRLLEISRRYQIRFNAGMNDDVGSRGYEGFGEAARDLETVLDAIWVSGTPSLQKPYLLNVALATCTYIPSFPFTPRETFKLLNKLDLAFSSLMQGQDLESGETLPGFQDGRGKLSTTEKVRIRGLVERTRIAVMDVSRKSGDIDDRSVSLNTQTEDEEDFTTDEDMDIDGPESKSSHIWWEMAVARVYEKTIIELGTSLDVSGPGGFG